MSNQRNKGHGSLSKPNIRRSGKAYKPLSNKKPTGRGHGRSPASSSPSPYSQLVNLTVSIRDSLNELLGDSNGTVPAVPSASKIEKQPRKLSIYHEFKRQQREIVFPTAKSLHHAADCVRRDIIHKQLMPIPETDPKTTTF